MGPLLIEVDSSSGYPGFSVSGKDRGRERRGDTVLASPSPTRRASGIRGSCIPLAYPNYAEPSGSDCHDGNTTTLFW